VLAQKILYSICYLSNFLVATLLEWLKAEDVGGIIEWRKLLWQVHNEVTQAIYFPVSLLHIACNLPYCGNYATHHAVVVVWNTRRLFSLVIYIPIVSCLVISFHHITRKKIMDLLLQNELESKWSCDCDCRQFFSLQHCPHRLHTDDHLISNLPFDYGTAVRLGK